MTEKHDCAKCNTTDITAPLCMTCQFWFCEACTAEILQNLPGNDWVPCMQIDGNPCPEIAD